VNQSLLELGKELQQHREKKGLTIDALSMKTKIAPKFLESMEQGRFDFLPHTYVRAFVRTFAQEVGLDAQVMLRQFESARQTTPGKIEADTTQPEPAKEKQDSVQKQVPKEGTEDNGRFDVNKFMSDVKGFLKYYGVFLLGLVAIILLLVFVLFRSRQDKNQSAAQQRFDIQQPDTSRQVLRSAPEQAVRAKTIPKIEEKEFKLTVTAVETTWMRIVFSDSLADEATFAPGDVRSWTSQGKLYMRIGNAGGLVLKVDDKELGLPGKSGGVANIVVSKDGFNNISSAEFPPEMTPSSR
jgi:cytoskeletal protein RodZ